MFFSLALIYGSAYVAERALWTSKAKERELKRQFSSYAKTQFQSLEPLIATHIRGQVQKELTSTLVLACGAAEGAGLEIKAELEKIRAEMEGAREVLERAEDTEECAQEMEEILKVLASRLEVVNSY